MIHLLQRIYFVDKVLMVFTVWRVLLVTDTFDGALRAKFAMCPYNNFWVASSYYISESVDIGDWFRIFTNEARRIYTYSI